MKLSELPASVGVEVVRGGDFQTLGLLTSRLAGTLACLHDPARAGEWRANASVTCVITSSTFAPTVPDRLGLALASEPRESFADVQRYLASTEFYGKETPTEIAADARVHPDAVIDPLNVRVGPGAVVEAGAVILGRVTIGPNAIVRAGAVVGAEGFHPVPYRGGQVNMPHCGSVIIGEGAEVGANSVVCRSVFNAPTKIGFASILGPMVYVAHGSTLGERCRIAAGARICGSATIGNDVFVGPNAVIANLIHVGDGARISIGSVVVRDVPDATTVSGNLAVEHRKFLEVWSRLFK